MRWAALVLCFVVACKKKEAEPEPAPLPTTPSVGRSTTVIADHAGEPATGSGSAVVAQAPDDAGTETADAALYGGNGKPAYRDADGRIWPPGGPVYMGRGPDCTDKIDHCLRDGVWFAVGEMQRGKLYRATPVFEFEGKWWTFRRQEADYHKLFRTKVVEKPSELQVGSPVVWLIEQTSSAKWLYSEDDALTSSRWEAGIIESVGTTTFKVAGWGTAPIDTARVIVQQKNAP